MWADLALSGGLAALRQGLSFSAAQDDAKAKKAWQAYKNTMLKLSDANNQNILTVNENIARRSSSEQAFGIARSEYLTSAQAEVSAAASGVEGRSVNAVLFDVERNATMAQSRRKSDLEAQYLQIDNQRAQSSFQAAMQMDYSPIPEPNPATYMLNFATDVGKLYQSSRPK
ncbi:virion core protein, T7 gp14 family [Nitrobacteraceae bacterium UC4449_H16]